MIPTPQVFILAAGNSKRCGGQLKQLFLINGEPIIRRMIRQVREFNPDIKIHVITWHDELKFDDTIIIDTKIKPMQSSDSVLFSVPYWGDRNVVLVGDGVFTDETLRDILSYNGDFAMFGRLSCSVKPGSERVAFAFGKTESQKVIDLLKRTNQIFKNSSREDFGGLQALCWATHEDWELLLTLPLTYTDKKMPLYIRIIRPVRDYLAYRVFFNLWKPRKIIKFIPVVDSITTDIDTVEEYNLFVESVVIL